MGKRTEFTLSGAQRAELERWSRQPPKPYLRDKARALLRVADGESLSHVARTLRTPVSRESVRQWLKRYQADGREGLQVKAGRGRKPAFSPSQPG